MYTPHTLGGWEVDPLTFYRVVEALACIDASTAWCVWIASGNPVYVGRCLPDEGAEAVFGWDPQVATAGVVTLASGGREWHAREAHYLDARGSRRRAVLRVWRWVELDG